MKRSKRIFHSSIKWRVFLGCMILASVIIGFLWIFQTCFLDDFYCNIKEKQIQSSAQEIVKHIDDDDLDTQIETLSRDRQICIVITDETGYVLYSNEGWQGCVIHRMNALLYVRAYNIALENGGTYLERAKTERSRDSIWRNEDDISMSPETLLYTTITADQDGAVRFIMLNTKLTPLTATVETLQVQLIWITVILVGLGLLLAIILSYMITKPIQRINASAKQLANGNYEANFQESGYREITELAQTLNYAARELSKVEGLQRELVANISHDLRTPLTMIIGYAEVMRDLPGENTPENVQVIIDEAVRLSTLVNDVLDISKLQSGTETMQVEVFNLTDSIRDLLTRYSKMTDYTITFESDSDVWVKGDPLKLSQVLCNLINNAITHTGPDKKVTLIQTVTDSRVRITVIDTGEGIEQDKLQDIWERYYKVDKTHKRAQVGTGLGLSIVKSILDLHPGTSYGVQSKLGEGSRFWFEMERLAAPSLPEGTENENL